MLQKYYLNNNYRFYITMFNQDLQFYMHSYKNTNVDVYEGEEYEGLCIVQQRNSFIFQAQV